MNLIFLDFETYYDRQYSLKKLTPVEYILNPQFETICVAVKVNDGPTQVINGLDFKAWLAQFDPANTTTVTYNALFDNCILAWRYGFVPLRMIDALGMARALLGHKLRSLSLASVAEYLKLGKKGHTIANVIGMHRIDIMSNPALWYDFNAYAIQDCNLLVGVFQTLAKGFPKSEYKVMDLVLRAAVCPQLEIDVSLLTEHLAEVRAEKEKLLASCGVNKADLMSSANFSELLMAEGVEIATKISPTGNEIPALAKTDSFMVELLEHDNPRVQALAAARLGHKSTIEETRCERMLAIAACTIGESPLMPVPLRYSGAHTHRLSGDWKLNMQNLPRGSKLRRALIAPAGHQVIVADLGQIEARLNAWFCHATTLLGAFRDGKDPYALLASHIFQRPIDPKVDVLERFIGKQGVLGLGYGAGAPKFYSMVLRVARSNGMDMAPLAAMWTEQLAKDAVDTYRQTNREIKSMWALLDERIEHQWSGKADWAKVGPVWIKEGRVGADDSLPMLYDDIKLLTNTRNVYTPSYTYAYGGRRYTLYGAKLLENIIQYLARLILMGAARRLSAQGYNFALQAHDELAYVVPDKDVDNAKQIIHDEMVKAPSWAPDLPLTADIGVGQSYGEAK